MQNECLTLTNNNRLNNDDNLGCFIRCLTWCVFVQDGCGLGRGHANFCVTKIGTVLISGAKTELCLGSLAKIIDFRKQLFARKFTEMRCKRRCCTSAILASTALPSTAGALFASLRARGAFTFLLTGSWDFPRFCPSLPVPKPNLQEKDKTFVQIVYLYLRWV